MITRAKASIYKPKSYTAAASSKTYDHTIEPTSVKETLSKPEWYRAMQDEYLALQKNDTWNLVDLPAGCRTIGCKWVFKSKHNADGSFQRHKARLVAKGYHQREGFDFHETFSPVVKPTTVRVVLNLALFKQWHIHQIDINNAFLHGELTETVYMNQPPGFNTTHKNKVCKLHKAIYGLKQAPRSWFQKLSTTLIHMGFRPTRSDTSLFVRNTSTSTILLLIYVDDIIITGSSQAEMNSLILTLHTKFSLKDLGPLHHFLGIEVSHTSDEGLFLSQK
uniref:Retrovirus-related Pol polyprotein from transposon TNT 1-94 n=1 Tax=Cajanus cajan TaxID=3821 RepID=A0A151QQS4_CAJCA|nr:Retrovirus-related Pol polyprotein from transposon TNT 1-94 [Cajanus cajan]